MACGVCHRHSQSHSHQHRQVRQIVPHIGNSVFRQPRALHNFFIRRNLLRALFIHEFHSHLARAAPHRRAFASRDDSRAQSHDARERQPRAVVRVERLQFQRRSVRLRLQEHVPARQHAVHIHQQQLNFLRALLHARGYLPIPARQLRLLSLILSLSLCPLAPLRLSVFGFKSVPESTNHADAPRRARAPRHPPRRPPESSAAPSSSALR